MRLGRRDVVLGAAALSLVPARGWCAEIDVAAAALDAASSLPPAEALARLAPIDLTRLSSRRRLDVLAARAGLAIDRRLLVAPDDLAARIARTLGNDVTVASARTRLQRALAHLHAEADRCFTVAGVTGGSVGDRYRRLFSDARFLPEDSEAGRASVVAAMRATLAPMRTLTCGLLPGVPDWVPACDVRALSAAEIAAGKSGYRVLPTPARAGIYVVDLKDVRRRPFWSLPSVVAHELLPGHMAQLGIEGIAPPHPLRATYASAFIEGWGIFAEALVAETGMFASPYDRLGHLHWLIFRAARGLVDIGMHGNRWSIVEARARLAEWQGMPAYFASFDADLTHIVGNPGVRAAEALAWLALFDRMPRGAAARSRWLAAVLVDGRKRTELIP